MQRTGRRLNQARHAHAVRLAIHRSLDGVIRAELRRSEAGSRSPDGGR